LATERPPAIAIDSNIIRSATSIQGIHATGGESGTEAPEVDNKEIKMLEEIGRGNFGKVFKGQCRGKIVAVKQLNSDLKGKQMEDFRKEVSVLTHLRHPNVVLFMGACTEEGKLSIVTEFMPNGDVGSYLKKNKNQPLLFILKMARDVALGMNWLHCSKPPIIHRDLKPGNLLIDENFTVKVCDFGLSNFQRSRTFKDEGFAAGTPLWMAPEVLTGRQLSEKVDVYAFAVVLWEMLTGKDPFGEFDSFNSFVDAIVDNNVRPPIPPEMHPALQKLLKDSWEKESYMRPSFKDLITRIEAIMVDATVPDTSAANFWKACFTGQLSVVWSKFAPAFFKELKESSDAKRPEYKCLKKLLTKGTEPDDKLEVQLEGFGLMVKWFGPLTYAGGNILARLRGAMSHEWFHGDMERLACEALLSGFGQQHGTFLVRLSTTEPIDKNPFTISKVTSQGSVSHQRASALPNNKGYFITLKKQDGTQKNIEAAGGIENLIAECSSKLGLTSSCPGSLYLEIFKPQKIDGYGQDTEVEDGY